MKFNDVFDTDEVLAWYDGDPQDGTYYRSQEPSRKPFENDFYGVDDRDDRHEEIKKHAALYICAHKELLKKSDYRIAYNKLLDEYARDYRKLVEMKNQKLLSWIAWTIIALFAFDWIMRIPFGNNYSGPI